MLMLCVGQGAYRNIKRVMRCLERHSQRGANFCAMVRNQMESFRYYVGCEEQVDFKPEMYNIRCE